MNENSINYDKLDNIPQIVINNNVAPAGVAPVKEEDVESRREAHLWAHRLNISSKIHIGAGVVAALAMAHAALNARHIAERMLHQGGRHPHPHPHPWHGEEEVDGRHPHPHPHPHPWAHRFVSQAEFGVYDIFGIIAFIGLMASLVLVSAGKHSLRASHWHKARFTHRVFHGHILRVLAISLMGYYARHRAEEMTRIIWRSQHHPHPHPHPHHNSTETTARNLEEDETIELFQTEEPTVAEPIAEMYEEPTDQEQSEEGHEWNRHHHHRNHGAAFALVFGLATAAHLHILKKLERAQKHREETSNVSA
jgi:hypothetical protein